MTIAPETAGDAVRCYYTLVDSGDIDGLLALFDENASYQRPGHTIAVRAGFAGVLKDGRDVSVRFADFFELSDEARFLERETFFFAPSV